MPGAALFALASAKAVFACGGIFNIFPVTVAAPHTMAQATVHCRLLYTAKGVAMFRVPLASLATQQGGHWDTVLAGAAAANLAAGLMAKGVLQPRCRRWLQRPR